MKEKTEILIVFASSLEAEGLYKLLNDRNIKISLDNKFKIADARFEILITGIGIFAATYSITKKIISEKFDLVINTGICGSYTEDFCIGDTVSVILDEFADFGVSYADGSFKTMFDEKILKNDIKPFSNGKLYNPLKTNIDTELPKVTSITVNNVSGNNEQIDFRKERFNPDIETTEGAAIVYVCREENIPFLQIRTVSNKVEERNKDNWNIPLAIGNLSEELYRILKEISDKKQEIIIK